MNFTQRIAPVFLAMSLAAGCATMPKPRIYDNVVEPSPQNHCMWLLERITAVPVTEKIAEKKGEKPKKVEKEKIIGREIIEKEYSVPCGENMSRMAEVNADRIVEQGRTAVIGSALVQSLKTMLESYKEIKSPTIRQRALRNINDTYHNIMANIQDPEKNAAQTHELATILTEAGLQWIVKPKSRKGDVFCDFVTYPDGTERLECS